MTAQLDFVYRHAAGDSSSSSLGQPWPPPSDQPEVEVIKASDRDVPRTVPTSTTNNDHHDDRYVYGGLAATVPNYNLLIRNVHIPHADRENERQLFDVACVGGRVWSVNHVSGKRAISSYFAKWQEVDGKEGLLIPSYVLPLFGNGIGSFMRPIVRLCHPHIHLDKCFILDQCDELITG